MDFHDLKVWLTEHEYAFDDVQSLSDTAPEDIVKLLSILDIKTVGDLVECISVEKEWI